MTDQTDLWETEADGVRDSVEATREELAFAREEATVLRGREQRAGEEARLAEVRATSLAAQVGAREALERTYEGISPAVAAVMARPDQLAGGHGPLADYLPGGDDPARSAAIEAYLGP